MTVPQNCTTGLCHSIVPHDCATLLCHTIVPQDYTTRLCQCHTTVPHDYTTRLCHTTVPQDYTTRLYPWISFNFLISNLSAWIDHSRILLLADDLKICRDLESVEGCSFRRRFASRCWFCTTVVCWKLHVVQKTKIIYLVLTTNSTDLNYNIWYLTLCSDCIKYRGVMFHSKVYFHSHVDFAYSQASGTLELIRFITYSFSSLDSLVVFV
jgi:hypothetical protein